MGKARRYEELIDFAWEISSWRPAHCPQKNLPVKTGTGAVGDGMRREPGRGREDTREGCLSIGLAGAGEGGEAPRGGCLSIGRGGAGEGGRGDGVGDGPCAGPCTFFRQAG